MSSGLQLPYGRRSSPGGPSVAGAGARAHARATGRRLLARPELVAVMALAAGLNLWGLSINGWANTYYSAAVRSMSKSWHDFLFAAMDPSGLMTADKPPLALWVQALSVRVFGFHPLSILVPQALMGVVAVALVYDLTCRHFGRAAGFAAGVALATTPMIVAVSRHNNPDELLVLCCVAAVWSALRALERGSTRWLVLSAVCVGLGFETKMAVALLVVPGIAAAWLWVAPERSGSLRSRLWPLAGAGAAGLAVATAWPLLVTLTPAADRPWISGTSDNSVWSLIFGYNGLGRVAGQAGGPGGAAGPGGGSMFGGATGPLRLLQSDLGNQAGWLLGAALVAGLALLALTRLRRRDPRTGFLVVVGGALLCSAVVFSFAQGIFHPYYVSFLAPYIAALVGAGVGLALPGRDSFAVSGRARRIIGPLVIAGGVVTEVAVLNGLGGELDWAWPVLAVAFAVALLLAAAVPPRVRAALLGAAMAMLLAAPATWAADTLGHATSATFPAGGPASASGPGGAGPGLGRRSPGRGGNASGAGGPGRFVPGAAGGTGGAGAAGAGAAGAGAQTGGPAGAPGVAGLFGGSPPAAAGGMSPGRSFGGLGGGGPFGADTASLRSAIRYVRAHGGGPIGVESQSTAASTILSSGADVAGLGGFSGRESSVTAAWLAQEVSEGRLRWVLVDAGGQGGLPGDTRSGSSQAFSTVAKACRAMSQPAAATATGGKTGSGGVGSSTGATLYDCEGRANAILAAANR